jgi:glyoxylase-like metal-dependent hydrolase (beta-lactamase superfamily II)
VLAGIRPGDPPEDNNGPLDAAVDRAFTPNEQLSDGMVIEGAGYCIEAIATPGHTGDHFAFALVGADTLLSGDHVMGWSTTVVAPPDGSMADYMASLDRLLSHSESTYLPAHGGTIVNATIYVRALAAHRRMRELAILDRLRQGDRTIGDLVGNVYAGLDPALAGAAALSTLAHLEHLIGRGLAATDGRPTLGARYWAADAGGEAPAATAAGSG